METYKVFFLRASQAMLHNKDRQALLEAVCRIAVDSRLFKFAWIGLREPEDQDITIVARAGNDEGYIDRLRVSAREDVPEGKGPSGEVIRTGDVVIVNDIAADPRITLWREALLARRVNSLVSIPLVMRDQTIGVLSVYAERAHLFDASLVEQLRSLAADLAYALDALDNARAVHHNAEAIRALYEIVSSPENFKEKLCALFKLGCRLFNLSNGLLARVEGERLQVISSYALQGGMPELGSHLSADSYCRLAINADGPIAIARTDPDQHPVTNPAGAYFGTPVKVKGRLFGTLCFMGTEPRHTSFTDTDKDFLRLMAQWVGTELERQATEKALAERQELFRLAHNFAGITTSEVNLNNNVLTWHNPLPGIFGSNSGFEPVQMPLDQFFQRFHPDDRERVKETLWTGWKTGQDFNMKYRLLWPDGSIRWREVYGTLIRDDNGQPSRLLGIALDITEHKEIEARLDFLAHRDTLTGLVNRAFFQDYLQKTLRRADRHGSPVALLFLDLDQFKQINDTLGHDCGDELLKAVGNLLTHCVRKMDAVARLGGDEFAIVLEDIRTVEDAIRMAEKILQSLAAPIRLSSGDVFINTSIGIACYDPHNAVDGEDATTLIKQADIAMYHAKGLGRGAFQVYNEELSRQLGKRRATEIALRKAVKDEAFVVHYQPQVDLKSGRLVGMEALIRWAHSGENLVLPEEFISVAEETGLILPIGAWILKTVCRQIKSWTEAGYPPLLAAVNVSLRQFQRGDIVALITRTLQDTGLAPERIKLEVTESILMSNVQRSTATLETLRAMGIKIEVDDFGTGHSSLAYLKQLPLDALKIDQSFVHELNNKNNRAIVRAVISMARSLDLRIIAEGVETDAQRDFLAREGCDEIQGNLIGPPVPAEIFKERYLNPAQNRDDTSAAPSPDLTVVLASDARE